ncbi:MAG: succinate dehydrogenase, hydrophobic membrane anchor protein [Gammaproteobacteria bacterium]|nr:succinate dehydrogenase, hydrophobic membrane anchor protein [Gammaproteobacteria bacterium]
MSRRIDGLRTWVWQRISAVYLLGFTLYLFFYFLSSSPMSYEQWSSWVAGPVASVAIVLFFMMLLVHAWVGIRDVVMDYIHPLFIRALILILAGFSLLSCGIWLARILVRTIVI